MDLTITLNHFRPKSKAQTNLYTALKMISVSALTLGTLGLCATPTNASSIGGPGGLGTIVDNFTDWLVVENFNGTGPSNYIDKVFSVTPNALEAIKVDFNALEPIDSFSLEILNGAGGIGYFYPFAPFDPSSNLFANATLSEANSILVYNNPTKTTFGGTANFWLRTGTGATDIVIREYITGFSGPITSTPTPIPLLGLGAAYGYSRKLRNRIRSTRFIKLAGASS